jgi:4-amino-4-deoxy-L-arabinose transferase-like glycosyltransferase
MRQRLEHFGEIIRTRPRYLNLTAAILLVLIFLALNLAILMSGGIRIGGDSPRYLEGAANVVRGLPLEGGQISYLGYIAVIALCQRIGIGLPGVIAVQLVLAALAAIALYDLGRRLHGHYAGLISAGLFVANPDNAGWHAFILTDSLYISLVVLSVWGVHTASERKRYWYILAALVLVSAALMRPNGLFLMAVALLYLVYRSAQPEGLRWLVISILLLASVLGATGASRFYQASRHRPPVSALSNGGTGVAAWNLSMPPAATPVEGGWAEVLRYVAAHPFDSLRLACTRLAIELIHIRPFYSFRHNLVLLAALPFLYLLALLGLWLKRDSSLARFIVSVIIVHLFLVALTFADWDGRYLLYILPLILLFSSCAIVALIELYLSARTKGTKR